MANLLQLKQTSQAGVDTLPVANTTEAVKQLNKNY